MYSKISSHAVLVYSKISSLAILVYSKISSHAVLVYSKISVLEIWCIRRLLLTAPAGQGDGWRAMWVGATGEAARKGLSGAGEMAGRQSKSQLY